MVGCLKTKIIGFYQKLENISFVKIMLKNNLEANYNVISGVHFYLL